MRTVTRHCPRLTALAVGFDVRSDDRSPAPRARDCPPAHSSSAIFHTPMDSVSGLRSDGADREAALSRNASRRRCGAGAAGRRIVRPVLRRMSGGSGGSISRLDLRPVRSHSSRRTAPWPRPRLRRSTDHRTRRGVRPASRRLGTRREPGDRRGAGAAQHEPGPAFLRARRIQSRRGLPLHLGEPFRGRRRRHRGVACREALAADRRVVELRRGSARDPRVRARDEARGSQRRHPHPSRHRSCEAEPGHHVLVSCGAGHRRWTPGAPCLLR